MKGTLTIAKREIAAYFNSPVAYIFIVAFLLSCGTLFFFVGNFFAAGQATMRGYFSLMPFVLSVLAPALTMRLWAEERRQGTYELLLTMPFRDVELVVGKYVATMAVIATTLALSLPVPLLSALFGRFDVGTIVAEYCGALLMASAAVAIGQAVSGASRNQISAFMLTVLVLLALSLLSRATSWLDLPAWIAGLVNWVSLSYHFSSFSKGVIDTRDIAYFAILTAGGLYATTRLLSAGKWR
ncbi:MAG: ABC transporter permease [Spirochaetae bacterium HGW-Spirochaetae-3]|jgi:ABC-2 type transport system permease protein|nr:MAG: ABC transporter permease [Spirochaetae bacterium HGW-Spirochaetae-3]